jgi:hypothetical protein
VFVVTVALADNSVGTAGVVVTMMTTMVTVKTRHICILIVVLYEVTATDPSLIDDLRAAASFVVLVRLP